MNLKNNLKFFIIFTLAIVLFEWKLIAMKSIFIGGDNFVQFYPWLKTYAEHIKHFDLPFWTRYMQSGFPLMAEGQIGGFYPLNILFFFVLPFNLAFNYSIVFHFIIAGAFMYLLTRKLGACEWGGTLAALIFCFGSAYAGCFYNIITLKTLSWTPFVFFLFELFFEKREPVYIIIAGVIYGMQLLAGFAQVAIYCWVFYLIYFLLRSGSLKAILYFLVFSAISFGMFMPQFLLTYKLLLLSSRHASSLQFALWGSFNPVYLPGIVFPYWARLSAGDFYLSIFGILFLISSFYLIKSDKKVGAVFTIFALSFLLALGKYDPLYVLFLKLFNLYSLRNPSKFLFFTALSASILIGRGFSEFLKDDFKYKLKALKIYSSILCVCGVIFFVSKILFTAFKDTIIKLGEQYVSTFIFGKEAHRYDLVTYMDKVRQIYAIMIDGVSLKNISNISSWLFVILALIISWAIIKKRKTHFSFNSKGFVISLVIADLFIYSFIGKGFMGNLRSADALIPANPGIFNYIKNDKSIFRVLPYGIGSGNRLPAWIMPNANMAYDIDSVAGYTPLANEYYMKALSSLEIIDNSLGVLPPKKNSIDDTVMLLRLLNVKYVISAEEINRPYLTPVLKENDVYLYLLKDSLPRAFALRDLSPEGVDSNINVKMIQYKSGEAVLNIEMPYDGFLAFSENNYPGWRAFDNGKAIEIRAFSLIQAVKLDKGKHVLRFVYNPWVRNEK
jgi:hypothetical protein